MSPPAFQKRLVSKNIKQDCFNCIRSLKHIFTQYTFYVLHEITFIYYKRTILDDFKTIESQ